MSKSSSLDIELGQTVNATEVSNQRQQRFPRRLSIVISSVIGASKVACKELKLPKLFSWPSWSSNSSENTLVSAPESPSVQENKQGVVQIEDFPGGYPQFSAFMTAHDCFHIFRRFTQVRTRLLLLDQVKVSRLEQQLNRLDSIDAQEGKGIFLANAELDANDERRELLSSLKKALASYDDLLARTKDIAALPAPQSWNVKSVRNWLGNKACIAKEETAFLDHREDLATCHPQDDMTLPWLDQLITIAMQYCPKKAWPQMSRDPNVFILPRSHTELVGRLFLTPLTIVLLLTPVIACQYLDSLTLRLVVLIVAVAAFVTFLSVVSRAKMTELAVAGATYSTVLLVFIASPGTHG